METIEIKNIYGNVIFKHTAKNNTVKLTIETAVSCGVSLARANLEGVKLVGANLAGANLEMANLAGANLERANLVGAVLNGADLADAKLSSSVLSWANLVGANLEDADISWADLIGANLKGADIERANIYGANVERAKNIPFIPLSCPSEGAFVGWKKIVGGFLVKLQIPEDARRLSATTRKCRCDKAMVLDITSLDGEEHYDEVTNNNYNETIYKVGEMVYPDSFDENRWAECSHGIHFFVNKEDVINY